MRVCVTGGTGFIGAPVVQALSTKGHEVLVISKSARKSPAPHVLQVDLATGDWQSAFIDFAPKATIHLAWEGIPDFGAVMSERNARAGAVFLDVAAKHSPRVVGIGSAWERTRHDPFTVAKQKVRAAGESAAKRHHAEFLWARLFFVYGPGQREGALIPSLVRTLMAGKPAVVMNPAVKNDFIYIDDAVRAIVLLATEHAPSGLYEVGSGVATSVGEVVRLVHEQCGLSYAAAPLPPALEENPLIADTTTLMQATSWKPATTLAEGVKKTVAHLRHE